MKSLFLILLILSGEAVFAKVSPKSSVELEFLYAVRKEAIKRAADEAAWTRNLLACIKNSRNCKTPDEYANFMLETPQLVRSFRQMQILSNFQTVQSSGRMIPNFRGYPSLSLDDTPQFSEVAEAREVLLEDVSTIKRQWKLAAYEMHSQGNMPFTEQKMEGVFLNSSSSEAQRYYRDMATRLAAEFPYVPFITVTKPSEKDYIKALRDYLHIVNKTHAFLKDTKDTTDDDILNLDQLIQKKILVDHPEWNNIYADLIMKAPKPYWTLGSWVKGLTELVTIGFTMCFVVSSLAQAWPIAALCSGAGLMYGGYMLVNQIIQYNKELNFAALGLTGQARIQAIYANMLTSGALLALSVVGLAASAAAAEGSIQTALQLGLINAKNNLKSTTEIANLAKKWLLGELKGNLKRQISVFALGGFQKTNDTKESLLFFPTYSQVVDLKNQFVEEQRPFETI